jgi:hypothetical protein
MVIPLSPKPKDLFLMILTNSYPLWNETALPLKRGMSGGSSRTKVHHDQERKHALANSRNFSSVSFSALSCNSGKIWGSSG